MQLKLIVAAAATAALVATGSATAGAPPVDPLQGLSVVRSAGANTGTLRVPPVLRQAAAQLENLGAGRGEVIRAAATAIAPTGHHEVPGELFCEDLPTLGPRAFVGPTASGHDLTVTWVVFVVSLSPDLSDPQLYPTGYWMVQHSSGWWYFDMLGGATWSGPYEDGLMAVYIQGRGRPSLYVAAVSFVFYIDHGTVTGPHQFVAHGATGDEFAYNDYTCLIPPTPYPLLSRR